MKTYKTQSEVESDIRDDWLIIDDDVTFECDINISANIRAWNINALNINALDISANNINARDIKARNIKALKINAWDIDALNINACNINARNIKARNISYFAYCIAYKNIVCDSWRGTRNNHLDPIAIDGDVIIRGDR